MYWVWISSEDTQRATGRRPELESPVLTLANETKHPRQRGLPGSVREWSLATTTPGRKSLLKTASELWPEAFDHVRGLVEHALLDAGRSDFLTGVTPETWSPAGRADHASLGRWIATAGIDIGKQEPNLPDEEGIPQVEGLLARQLTSGSPCLVVQGPNATPRSVIGLGNDAFLVVVPAGARGIRVQVEPSEDTPGDEHPDCPPWDELTKGIPDPESWEVLVWRWYEGENSRVVDGCSAAVRGVHQFVAVDALVAGVLVGRVVRISADRGAKNRSDPSLVIRRRAALRGLSPSARDYIVKSSPPLSPSTRAEGGLVVVVHGTHSTGVHLAISIRNLWDEHTKPPTRIVRFEHDTWHTVESNARDLADRVVATGASDVLLVAHSRGGLVATRAARMIELMDQTTTAAPQVSLITLGTPFSGTPVAYTADALWAATHTLMGAFRLAGGPAVDATTRVLSWSVKRRPPEGLKIMNLGDERLRHLQESLPVDAQVIGGQTRDQARDFTGLWSSFRKGFQKGVFKSDEDNDMVVATASSLADRPVHKVSSDHSSYMLVPEVRQLVKRAIAQLPVGTLAEKDGKTLVW